MRYITFDRTKSGLERTQEAWDFTHCIPVPKIEMKCPSCGEAEDRIVHLARFAQNKKSPHPWRCNVSLKCMCCGCSTIHGLVISEEYYNNRPLRIDQADMESFRYHEILKILGLEDGSIK